MKRFKMALKAAKVPGIIGLIILIAGIVLLVIDSFVDASLLVAGLLVTIAGILCLYFAYITGRQMMHAICPECQKFMGDSNKGVNYTYECNQYKENYDSSTHKFKNYTFYYTCTIECPHCGNTSTFEYKLNAKTQSEANVSVDKYLKATLKLKG